VKIAMVLHTNWGEGGGRGGAGEGKQAHSTWVLVFIGRSWSHGKGGKKGKRKKKGGGNRKTLGGRKDQRMLQGEDCFSRGGRGGR